MSIAAVAVGLATAAAGAFAAQAIIMGVILAAATYYQQQQSKKAAAKAADAAEKAADAAKGFQLVQEGEPKSLALVYGRALVGGVRVFVDTKSRYTYAAPPEGCSVFASGGARVLLSGLYKNLAKFAVFKIFGSVNGLNKSMPGYQHEYLFVQQALCISGINTCVRVDIQKTDSQDKSFNWGQRIYVYPDGGKPCPLMTANFSKRSKSAFTGAAFATGVFKLNRDEPQYQGIPDMQCYIEGMRIRTFEIVEGELVLLETLSYTNNPALCLLDYMTNEIYGRGLSLDDIDLKSFYLASLICDEVVIDNVALDGDFWKRKLLLDPTVVRQIKRYELNAALDTDATIRDNIDVILKSMGDADLVWAAGKFRLNLTYPQSVVPATGAYAGLVLQTGSGVDTHLFECVTDGTVELPGDSNDWKRVDRTVTESDIFMDENFVEVWPTAQERLNFFSVRYLNEAENFKQDTASWPPKFNFVDGSNTDRGVWSATAEYSTSDIVSHGGKSYQLSKGFKYKSEIMPSNDPTWRDYFHNTVYKTFLAEDNGINLEGSENLGYVSDYYHAVAYCENKVRLSRSRSGLTLALTFEFWDLEPGDFLNIVAPSLGVEGELVKVLSIEVMPEGFLKVDMEKFDANQLAWNAKDDEVVAVRSSYELVLPQVTALKFSPDLLLVSGSAGRLSWFPTDDNRVTKYVIKYTSTPPEFIDANTNWIELGSTTNLTYDIDRIPSGFYVVAVVAASAKSQAPKFDSLSGSHWPTVSIGLSAPFVDNTQLFFTTVYHAGDVAPETPVGGVFDFAALSFTTTPVGWTTSIPLSAKQLYRSDGVVRASDNSIVWSEPLTTSNPGTYVELTKPVMVVTQSQEGENIGYSDAVGKLTAVLNHSDVSAATSTTYSIVSTENCTVTLTNTGADRGKFAVTSLTGDRGSVTISVNFGGATFERTAAVIVFKLGYQPDLTPPPAPTGVSVSSTSSNVYINVASAQNFTEGHGLDVMEVYANTSPTGVFADAVLIHSFNNLVTSFGYKAGSPLYLFFVNKSIDGGRSLPFGGVNGIDATLGAIDSSMIDPTVIAANRSLTLTSTGAVMSFKADGTPSNEASMLFLVTLRNVTGTVVWSAKAHAYTGDFLRDIPLGDFFGIKTISPFDVAADVAYVLVTATLDDLSDYATVVSVVDGSDAVSGVLTNEFIGLSADSDGSITDYTGASGKLVIYQGSEVVAGEFYIMSLTDVVATMHATTGVYTVTELTADTGQILVRGIGAGVVIDKVVTVAKIKAGANGSRGSVRRYVSDPLISGWSDEVANTAVGTTPIKGDEVTITDGSTFATMRVYDGTAWVLPGQVIDGALLVTGTITAPALAAGIINSTHISSTGITADNIKSGELAVSQEIRAGGNLIISGDGWIESYSAAGYSRGGSYSRMDSGNFETYKFVPALGTTVPYNALTRMETGVADNAVPVTIPGYWTEQPRIIVSPHSLQLYDAEYRDQDQVINCQANSILETAAGSMRWSFVPTATLSLIQSTVTVIANEIDNDTTNTWYTGQYVTNANSSKVNVEVDLSSVRGTGVAGKYYYRKVIWTIEYLNGASWTPLINTTVNMGTSLSSIVSTKEAFFPSAGVWTIRVKMVASDAGGTFTASGTVYDTAQDLHVVNKTAPGVYANVILNSDNPFVRTKTGQIPIDGYSLPASDNGNAWGITSIQYAYDYSYYLEVVRQSSASNTNKAQASLAMPGVSKSLQTVNANQIYKEGSENIIYGDPYYMTFIPVNTTISTTSYPSTLGTSVTDITISAEGIRGNAKVYLYYRNLSIRVNRRRLKANSTSPVNSSKLNQFMLTLTTSQILATGSLSWLAIGN